MLGLGSIFTYCIWMFILDLGSDGLLGHSIAGGIYLIDMVVMFNSTNVLHDNWATPAVDYGHEIVLKAPERMQLIYVYILQINTYNLYVCTVVYYYLSAYSGLLLPLRTLSSCL